MKTFSTFLALILASAPAGAQTAGSALTPAQAFHAVDQHWKQDQLHRLRKVDLQSVDACTGIKDQKTFAQAIEFGITEGLKSRINEMNSVVVRTFSLKSGADIIPVGLISHPLCAINQKSAAHILPEGFVPEEKVLTQLNRLVSRINKSRAEVAQKVTGSTNRLKAYYGVLMGCLAYEESLANPGDPGSSLKARYDQAFAELAAGSKALQSRYTVDGAIQRPPGVSVYVDRPGGYTLAVRELRAKGELTDAKIAELQAQYPGWTTIGLYQMSAILYGNIDPCFDVWNKERPQCSLNKRSVESMALGLVSSGQSFNAFCGVQKIVHAFHSQVHSTVPTGTDLTNIRADGSLKPSAQRCVNLISKGGRNKIYSHFGPLGNSVKTNLPNLARCIDHSLNILEGTPAGGK